MQGSVLLKRSLIFILTGIMISSCTVMKPGATKTGRNLYETFFISIHTNQYFIKPLAFESIDGGKLWIDFTFRDKDELQDSATVNITIESDVLKKSISEAAISNFSSRINLEKISYIYGSKKKEKYHSRFTSKSDNINVGHLFSDNDWKVEITMNGSSISYLPTGKTMKNIAILEEHLFELIRE